MQKLNCKQIKKTYFPRYTSDIKTAVSIIYQVDTILTQNIKGNEIRIDKADVDKINRIIQQNKETIQNIHTHLSIVKDCCNNLLFDNIRQILGK